MFDWLVPRNNNSEECYGESGNKRGKKACRRMRKCEWASGKGGGYCKSRSAPRVIAPTPRPDATRGRCYDTRGKRHGKKACRAMAGCAWKPGRGGGHCAPDDGYPMESHHTRRISVVPERPDRQKWGECVDGPSGMRRGRQSCSEMRECEWMRDANGGAHCQIFLDRTVPPCTIGDSKCHTNELLSTFTEWSDNPESYRTRKALANRWASLLRREEEYSKRREICSMVIQELTRPTTDSRLANAMHRLSKWHLSLTEPLASRLYPLVYVTMRSMQSRKT